MNPVRPITIAITAMGGQGGGVLAGWIIALAEAEGYIAQSTSVPGVAQRTGATIYYVELFAKVSAQKAGQDPVLTLTPIPGDVDIVIASEMMEAGRALLRGFVTAKTTLIASDHRVFAISEKEPMGDGRQNPEHVRKLARATAGQFISFDMEQTANDAHSIISSVLFGALAGSGKLPFPRKAFENTIKASNKAVEANLRGFGMGFDKAASYDVPSQKPQEVKITPAPLIAPLLQRLHDEFPKAVHDTLVHGLKRCVDFQDVRYGALYLDRMAAIHELDQVNNGKDKKWHLTRDLGRYLALKMSFEDTIRVADLKTRSSRLARLRNDVAAKKDQIVSVTEFMHPRIEELCDVLPAPLGRYLSRHEKLKAGLGQFFKKGRRVETTSLRGFLFLSVLAALKPLRRLSLRYSIETGRIESWLNAITNAAPVNYALACEIAGLQRLIKGYGDTHERGLRNYTTIMAALETFQAKPDAHKYLKKLKDAALLDEDGLALQKAVQHLQKRRTS